MKRSVQKIQLYAYMLGAAMMMCSGWAQAQKIEISPELKKFAKAMAEKSKNQEADVQQYLQTHKVTLAPGSWIHHIENGQPVIYSTRSNVDALKSIKTNKLHPNGGLSLNLTGKGMEVNSNRARLGMWEPGSCRVSHQELVGRATPRDGSVFTSRDTDGKTDHATHVAASMMGAGVVAKVQGAAYEARLDTYNSQDDVSEMATAGGEGMLLSNHSYGANLDPSGVKQGYYSESCTEMDSLCMMVPYYLPIYAAGNDRDEANGKKYDLLTDVSNAKNSIQVGAVEILPNGYTGPSSVVMSEFSSFGPTDDGRIKPDYVTPGVAIYSAYSASDTTYSNSDGTSMASPLSCGSLFLLQQHHKNLKGSFMKASTLKALAIHTAEEAGDAPGPDYRFGWGLLNMKKAADLITNKNQDNLLKEESLTNAVPYTQDIETPGNSPLKVTIAWTDKPGKATVPAVKDDRTAKLVNDLDLRVIDKSTGTEISTLPWKLDPNNPDNPATKGDNTVDVTEQILVDNMPAGSYTVKITHKGTLQADQPFALIVSGLKSGTKSIRSHFKTNVVTNICAADTLIYESDSDGAITSYEWNFGANATPATANTVGPHKVVYSIGGQKTVTLKVSAAGTSDMDSEKVIIENLPAKPVVTAAGNVLTSSVTAFSYKWYLNGTAISGAFSKTYTATTSGNYQVEVRTDKGCGEVSDAYAYNTNGVEQVAATYSEVYPNPANDMLFINNSLQAIVSVEIYNTVGQLMVRKADNVHSTAIDLHSLPTGLYDVRITTQNGSQASKRISVIK